VNNTDSSDRTQVTQQVVKIHVHKHSLPHTLTFVRTRTRTRTHTHTYTHAHTHIRTHTRAHTYTHTHTHTHKHKHTHTHQTHNTPTTHPHPHPHPHTRHTQELFTHKWRRAWRLRVLRRNTAALQHTVTNCNALKHIHGEELGDCVTGDEIRPRGAILARLCFR